MRTPARFLWVLAIPGLRLRDAAYAGGGAVAQVPRGVYRGEEDQDRHGAQLLEGRVRLGVRGSGPDAIAARRGSDAGGRKAVSPDRQVFIHNFSFHNLAAGDNSAACICELEFAELCATILGVSCGAWERPGRDETGHREIFAVPGVGEEFLSAHNSELWEGPGAVCRISFASGRAATGAAEDYTSDHPRICGALARAGAGEKLDCAEAGGAAFVFQVLRARRDSQGKSGAAGTDAQAAKADSIGTFRGRDEWIFE